MRNPRLIIVAAVLALSGLTSSQTLGSGPGTFEEAKTTAAREGKPVLIDFYAVWCGPCKAFDKAVAADSDIQNAVDDFVLFETDAEREGLDLAKQFGVTVYPTFVVANTEGVTLNRWSGYEKSQFLGHTGSALADPTSMEEKAARYEKNPTAKDAVILAENHDSLSEYPDAVRLYREAMKLDPATDHSVEILVAIFYGLTRQDQFQISDLTGAADRVMASEATDTGDLFTVAQLMMSAAQKQEDLSVAAPYLKAVVERTEASTDPDVQATRRKILPDYALVVLHDPQKAVTYKKEAMPQGWMEDPGQLNGYAWWCFENNVSLDEAYDLAKKGVDLSEPGPDRAMILDTLAEICNARDDCHQALGLMKQAASDDPANKHYQKQLQRFGDLVAEKDRK